MWINIKPIIESLIGGIKIYLPNFTIVNSSLMKYDLGKLVYLFFLIFKVKKYCQIKLLKTG
ncbi:hypothetical protein DBR39_16110 [Chryseobacterium sp. KBW03]|nr:hypothetical protein DBR39_16110 [Chryseobacterium sp. KBW03]